MKTQSVYRLWTTQEEARMCKMFEFGIDDETIGAVLDRSPKSIEDRRGLIGATVRKVGPKVPELKTCSRPQMTVSCSHCASKKLVTRSYYNSAKKNGRQHFFCNKSCSFKFTEKKRKKAQHRVGYLPGAIGLEKSFYGVQSYGGAS